MPQWGNTNVIKVEIAHQQLTRFTASALFTAAGAAAWDTWWHVAVGRDTFWEPPHLLLYAAMLAALAAAAYGWHRSGEAAWRRLAIVLALIPLLAPFDALWHRWFGGAEALSSPLSIWSPPHAAFVVATIGGFSLLLPLIRRDADVSARRLFGGLSFAAVLASLLFLTVPLQPTGPHALMGFWGAGVAAAAFAGVLLIAGRWLPGLGGATLVAALFLLLNTLGPEGHEANLSAHDHPPAWLVTFSFLVPALLLDLLKRPPDWLRGAMAGVLWGAILYGLSPRFFRPEFQYGAADALIAIVTSLLGGGFAGILAAKIFPPTAGSSPKSASSP